MKETLTPLDYRVCRALGFTPDEETGTAPVDGKAIDVPPFSSTIPGAFTLAFWLTEWLESEIEYKHNADGSASVSCYGRTAEGKTLPEAICLLAIRIYGTDG